ncbi:MAG: hypothetical protein M3O09_09815 [Acidobacteriota bacterium]|nr:hypothetical protein [Acidobacteriota bacterium]
MSTFFPFERFSRPKMLAGLLLLLFFAQCLWLVERGREKISDDLGHMSRIQSGVEQIRGKSIAGTPAYLHAGQVAFQTEGQQASGYDVNHSPLWYLTAAAPVVASQKLLLTDPRAGYQGWALDLLARSPSLIFGLLLGASLWYVARRLYGNTGGFIALALYCFSPVIIRSSAIWSALPEMGATWGAFGAIFTAIAVAHTLYAPREVVLWNWRRILLLGLSLALAIGSQFSLLVLVPMALLFLVYLAPTRRGAAIVIWMSACVVALIIIFALYFFHPRAFFEGMRHADFLGIIWRAFLMPGAYRAVAVQVLNSNPAMVILLPAAFIAYCAWPRARYFGNTAPLLLCIIFFAYAVGSAHFPGLGFQLSVIPFAFVFVAGVISDVLETEHRRLAVLTLWILLAGGALWNLVALARLA